eukprot:gnl/Chilomastix_cuspidata/1819.p1 GENE.gnl/Chilomastix_cuspidata/1819~~gnl/Chilomastix_cuspidata/1819.p1  ORF type:complete len:189 (-),score=27.62 gnl/Chilomastix_cuspidata/1819:60-584(-)
MSAVPTYKIAILGGSKVGKTSIANRFSRDLFHEDTEETIGVDFFTHPFSLETHKVKFNIWDTAGNERFRSLIHMYTDSTDAVLFVYDITSQRSFLEAKMLIQDVQKRIKTSPVIALVGNKADLAHEREVSSSEALGYAQSNRFIFYETSARSSVNITELFYEISLHFLREDRAR